MRLTAFVLAGVILAAAAARAQEPEPASPPPAVAASGSAPVTGPGGFGAPGVWVFTYQTADDGSGYAFFHKYSGSASTVTLNPAVDYFLAPNISLGANLSFSHSTGSGNNFGAGVRAGYNLDLAGDIAFWPMARFFVEHYGSAHRTDTSLGVLAPFIWHATTHFFLGGGPDLNRGLSNGGYTEYGLDFIIGGWL
ncbi:MAG TPA: hypothetical protein VHO67_22060 [Polyangia bacterium]|nr:hypothetical protein [Polyangia bacterium]